jgi:sec-independent protein translocase protein TatA
MFPNLGPMEMLVVGVVAVLLFGKRLPEVGRSLGKGIVEFKKGLRGIEEELESATKAPATKSSHSDPYFTADPVDTAVPKFEPPTSAPVARGEAS